MDGQLDSYDLSSDDETGPVLPPPEQSVLGVDEAVVIKTRKRLAKLDDTRLLSANGIPLLRKKTAPRIHLKGKGHERGDLTRILTAYQIWAHGLFPKANFADFVYLSKRAGSTKTMRMYRRQWIDEEKTKPVDAVLADLYDEPHTTASHLAQRTTPPLADSDADIWSAPPNQPADDIDDDEIMALNQAQQPQVEDDLPDEDELAILQEMGF